MKKFIFVAITVFVVSFFASCGSASTSAADVESYVAYDMETSTHEVFLSNGENQTIAKYQLFVESNKSDLFLTQINFRLFGFAESGEKDELEFYDALDNFKVIINGQEIVPVEFSTQFIPQFDIPINGAVNIELRADVNAELPRVTGWINIERIFIQELSATGREYPNEMIFDPTLGNAPGTTTAIAMLYGENGEKMPNWQVPKITISNDDLGEECTESEVLLNNGSCVYDNCQINLCGNYGVCSTDLDNGQVQCDCPDGYESNEGKMDCLYRTGRYDVEAIEEERHVTEGMDIISHWNILVGNENSMLDHLEFIIDGDTDNFYDFSLQVNGVEVGEIKNYHPLYQDENDGALLVFNLFGEEVFLSKESTNWLRLKAHSQKEDDSSKAINVKISSFSLSSTDFTSPNGFTLPLKGDHTMGSPYLTDSYVNTGHPIQLPKTRAILD